VLAELVNGVCAFFFLFEDQENDSLIFFVQTVDNCGQVQRMLSISGVIVLGLVLPCNERSVENAAGAARPCLVFSCSSRDRQRGNPGNVDCTYFLGFCFKKKRSNY
jgi:hypothetical protein